MLFSIIRILNFNYIVESVFNFKIYKKDLVFNNDSALIRERYQYPTSIHMDFVILKYIETKN